MCVCMFRPQQFAWELLSLNPCQGFRGTSSKSLPSTSSVSCLSRWHLFFQLMLKSKLINCFWCTGLFWAQHICGNFSKISSFRCIDILFFWSPISYQLLRHLLILCHSVSRTGQSLTTDYPSGTVRALPVAMSAYYISKFALFVLLLICEKILVISLWTCFMFSRLQFETYLWRKWERCGEAVCI